MKLFHVYVCGLNTIQNVFVNVDHSLERFQAYITQCPSPVNDCHQWEGGLPGTGTDPRHWEGK